MIRVETYIQDELPPVDVSRLEEAVALVLERHEISDAEISLAVIDDAAMHVLNRQHLNHDYPTDVLSFVYAYEGCLEGEVVVSLDTAANEAVQYGWATADELLLYVIHGTLHLAGHDDHADADRTKMREQERAALLHFGLTPHYDER